MLDSHLLDDLFAFLSVSKQVVYIWPRVWSPYAIFSLVKRCKLNDPSSRDARCPQTRPCRIFSWNRLFSLAIFLLFQDCAQIYRLYDHAAGVEIRIHGRTDRLIGLCHTLDHHSLRLTVINHVSSYMNGLKTSSDWRGWSKRMQARGAIFETNGFLVVKRRSFFTQIFFLVLRFLTTFIYVLNRCNQSVMPIWPQGWNLLNRFNLLWSDFKGVAGIFNRYTALFSDCTIKALLQP